MKKSTIALMAAMSLTSVSLFAEEPFSGEESVRTSFKAAKEITTNAERPEQHADLKKGPTGSTIYGFLSYDENNTGGWYELSTDGSFTQKWEYENNDYGMIFWSSWLRNSKLCALSVSTYDNVVMYYTYQEMNELTGKVTKTKEYTVSDSPYFISAAYVPDQDMLYGYSRSSDGLSYYFSKAPASNISNITEIAAMEAPGNRCYSLCYRPDDDSLYGVNNFDEFVKIDFNGNQEVLADVNISDLSSRYVAGLVWSPYDGAFIWNPQHYGVQTSLYMIHPEGWQFEKLCDYDAGTEFSSFLTTDGNVMYTGPKAPVISNVSFTLGEKTGSITYTLPTEKIDGTLLMGSLDCTAYIDGESYKTLTGTPGESVTVEYTDMEQGLRTLRFDVKSEDVSSPSAVHKEYIGNDTPEKVSNVVMTKEKVTWDAVTKGTHNVYLDLSDLKYEVAINGEVVGETTSTSYTLDMAEAEYSCYQATVTAVCHEMRSEASTSEKIRFGTALSLPVNIIPTEDQAELMTIINADGGPDYGVWEYTTRWTDPCFASGWSQTECDDWLILPPISINDAEKTYSVSLEAAVGGYSAVNEYFEVWVGNAPTVEAMTTAVMDKTKAKSRAWTEYQNVFAVSDPGDYYVAVRAVSDPNQYSLLVRNITVSATDEEANGPAAVENLKVEATSDPDLTATISFDMPTTEMGGKALAADTEIVAKVEAAQELQVKGAPGSHQQLVVPTLQGDNIIRVTPYIGDKEGKSAETLVFTGVDRLMYVENYQGVISEDNMSVELTWEPPTESENGGYFKQTDITYWVYEYDSSEGEWLPTAEVGKDICHYTFTLPEGAPLQRCMPAIVAENAAGLSGVLWYRSFVIGTPYGVGMKETFDDLELHYTPMITSVPSSEYNDGAWTLGQPELVHPAYLTDQDYVLIGYTDSETAKVRMAMPKITTYGVADPTFILKLWTGDGAASDMGVYASGYDILTPEKIYSIPAGDGWEYIEVPIPEKWQGRKWITLYLDGTLTSNETYLLCGSYEYCGDISAVGEIANGNITISTSRGEICVAGLNGEQVAIYSVDGKRLAMATTGGEYRLAASPGVYIVRVGDSRRAKVIVH